MPLAFTADENVNSQVVRSLRNAGHIVYHVAEQSAGATDEKVLELARKTDSVLITTDKDFGEMVFRQRKLVPGVILVCMHSLHAIDPIQDGVNSPPDTVQEHTEQLLETSEQISAEALVWPRPAERPWAVCQSRRPAAEPGEPPARSPPGPPRPGSCGRIRRSGG